MFGLPTDKRKRAGILLAVAGGLLALGYFFRKQVGAVSVKAALLVGTPRGRAAQYADQITQVAQENGVSPFLIAAIMERESFSGEALKPPGPGGKGDFDSSGVGHGLGLMQLDIHGAPGPNSLHAQIMSDGRWTDPYWNMTAAVQDHILPDMRYFQAKGLAGGQLMAATIAAYNAGAGAVWSALQHGLSPDAVTTGKNYSSDVLAKLANLTNASSPVA